ncbi:MAG: serine/threonine protein kinase [Gemmataceae bacterium]
MKFTYSSGQRPLDGYTIKRGIGQGGFGEVYFAVSDGGKEVALKLVRGQSDVELRGVAQCLNLKHANLVNLYDMRRDDHGDHWVVMEYITGEPLNVVLNRHPNGLPLELARQWFLELAKAIGYLHDHGIVHRDLKPGNIFIENGLVKIGDYGLSKFISSSQRTAQTQSVGTVYYMAPEISTGNYNKQIDVYAAGVILYEMLTGQVPFDGESAGEILMKHLTTPPDLGKVPNPLVPILSKALAKNPAHRYASIADMARDVEKVGAETRSPPEPAGVIPVAVAAPKAPARPELIPQVLPAVTWRGQVAELTGAMALAAVLALVATTLVALVAVVFGQRPPAAVPEGLLALLYDRPMPSDFAVGLTWLGSLFFTTVALSWAVLIPAKLWEGRNGHNWQRRAVMLLLGVVVGMGVIWLHGWMPERSLTSGLRGEREATSVLLVNIPDATRYVIYLGLTLFAVRWWKVVQKHRLQRFSLFPVLTVTFWALMFLLIWPWLESPYGPLALVTASVIIQWASPWEQPPPPSRKRLRLRYA